MANEQTFPTSKRTPKAIPSPEMGHSSRFLPIMWKVSQKDSYSIVSNPNLYAYDGLGEVGTDPTLLNNGRNCVTNKEDLYRVG